MNKLILINIIQIQTFKAYFNNNKSIFVRVDTGFKEKKGGEGLNLITYTIHKTYNIHLVQSRKMFQGISVHYPLKGFCK